MSKICSSYSYNDLKKKRLKCQNAIRNKQTLTNREKSPSISVVQCQNTINFLVSQKLRNRKKLNTFRENNEQISNINIKKFESERLIKNHKTILVPDHHSNQIKINQQGKLAKEAYKQIVKVLIQKNKSKNRILKLNQIRSLAKSSKSKQKSLQTSRIISSRLSVPKNSKKSKSLRRILKFSPPQIPTDINLKTTRISDEIQIKNDLLIIQQSPKISNKKTNDSPTTTIKLATDSQRSQSRTKKVQDQNIKQSQGQMKEDFIVNISKIEKEKESDKSFINESLNELIEQFGKKKQKNVQRILDLIEMQTNQLKKLFNQREKKKKYQKYLSKFPQDFFKKAT